MLKDSLEKEGFIQSGIDPCLFLLKDAIVITYVDDCLIFSDNKRKIDAILDKFRRTFKLTDEGEDFKAY